MFTWGIWWLPVGDELHSCGYIWTLLRAWVDYFLDYVWLAAKIQVDLQSVRPFSRVNPMLLALVFRASKHSKNPHKNAVDTVCWLRAHCFAMDHHFVYDWLWIGALLRVKKAFSENIGHDAGAWWDKSLYKGIDVPVKLWTTQEYADKKSKLHLVGNFGAVRAKS